MKSVSRVGWIALLLLLLLTSCTGGRRLGGPTGTPAPLPTVSVEVLSPAPTATSAPTPTPFPSPTYGVRDEDMQLCLEKAREYRLDMSGKWVVVCQSRQVMLVGIGRKILREMPVSTGVPHVSETPFWKGRIGKFYGTFVGVDGSYADDGWLLFVRHGGTFLIHSLPYRMVNGKKVYMGAESLGREPASHGCIRLAPGDARWFREWNPEGAAILITPCNCGR